MTHLDVAMESAVAADDIGALASIGLTRMGELPSSLQSAETDRRRGSAFAFRYGTLQESLRGETKRWLLVPTFSLYCRYISASLPAVGQTAASVTIPKVNS